MSTALITAEAALHDIAKIRQQTQSMIRQAAESGDMMLKDFAIANGLMQLRDAFSSPEVMQIICGLQGTSLGFRHDREMRGQKYEPEIVRDCVIEALLRGVSMTGNQFNIIASRCYITVEGYAALLASFPGLTDLKEAIGVPQDARPWGKQQLMFVNAVVTCRLNGKVVKVECTRTPEMDGRLAVKAFEGEIDNAKGKARRRLLKLLYERVSGSIIPDAVDDGVSVAAELLEHSQEPVAVITGPEDTGEQPKQSNPYLDKWRKEYGLLKTEAARELLASVMVCDDTELLHELKLEIKVQIKNASDAAVVGHAVEERHAFLIGDQL